MPCGAPRVPGPGSLSLCPSTSGVVINDGDDVASSMEVRSLQADKPRRWRGSALCAQRIRRAALLRKVLTATSAAACVSSTKQWLLIRSSCGQLRLSDCWQTSQRWRHIHFLHFSQLRSEPDVMIHFVDDGRLPFLSEFGESWGVIAGKKAVVFLDNHKTQRGEAQLTYSNGGLQPPNLAPSVVHDTVTALFARLPPHHRRPMSGKGCGGSCLSRHRAQCAGSHFGFISRVVGMKTMVMVTLFVSFMSAQCALHIGTRHSQLFQVRLFFLHFHGCRWSLLCRRVALAPLLSHLRALVAGALRLHLVRV